MPSIAVLLAAAAATVPPQPQLTEQIRRADSELFDLSFVSPCDVPRFRAMLTDDIEFYHDKAGFNVRKADDFVAIYMTQCAARADPNASRSRRELVSSTLHVDPGPGLGSDPDRRAFVLRAARKGKDGAEKLVGRARFAHLWVLGSDSKWRLSRVLSYAHGPTK